MSYSDDRTAEAEFDAALLTLRRTPASIRQNRRRKIVNKIEALERELQLLDSLPESDDEPLPSPSQLAIEQNGSSAEVPPVRVPRSLARKPNKPRGLLMVIAEQPERTWKLKDARDVMVERDWLQPGTNGTKQIQNTAWKLKNRGELASPSNGLYRITPKGMEAISGRS